MNYSKGDTLIIVISIATPSEKCFLKKCNWQESPNWAFAYSDGSVWKYKNDNEDIDNGDDFSFLLINQCKCNNNDFCDKMKGIINKNKKRNIIVWTHKTDRGDGNCPPVNDSNRILDLTGKLLLLFYPFSHTPTSDSPFETALKQLPKDLNNTFNDIISLSLKIKLNPHIIALSILCQGYLAAHGKKDSLKGWEDVWKNLPDNLKGENFQLKTKAKTEEKNWWKPALGNYFNGTKLITELETVDEDKKTGIGCLIKIIKNKKDENEELYFDDKGKIVNDGMTQKFTGKVTEAYGNLKKILGNC